ENGTSIVDSDPPAFELTTSLPFGAHHWTWEFWVWAMNKLAAKRVAGPAGPVGPVAPAAPAAPAAPVAPAAPAAPVAPAAPAAPVAPPLPVLPCAASNDQKAPWSAGSPGWWPVLGCRPVQEEPL